MIHARFLRYVLDRMASWSPRLRQSEAELAEMRRELGRERRLRRNAERAAHSASKALALMTSRYEREADSHQEDLRATADAYARPVIGRYVFARAPQPAAEPVPSQPVPGPQFVQDRKSAATHRFFEDLKAFDKLHQ